MERTQIRGRLSIHRIHKDVVADKMARWRNDFIQLPEIAEKKFCYVERHTTGAAGSFEILDLPIDAGAIEVSISRRVDFPLRTELLYNFAACIR